MQEEQITLPPGSYYLGDPCYQIDPDQWHEYLKAKREGKDFQGHPVVAFHTRYGDGRYRCSDGRGYNVDSGMIGLVPQAMAVRRSTRHEGRMIPFLTEVSCSTDGEGDLRFGHIRIRT